MTSREKVDELSALHDELLPVLSRAAVGDFDSDIKIDSTNSVRVNELLMGVQVLLDVINDKIEELENANTRLADSRDRSVLILDDVLRKSLER